MKIDKVTELGGFRGINPLRFLMVVLVILGAAWIIASFVTASQVKLVTGTSEDAPAAVEPKIIVTPDVLIAQVEAERMQVEASAEAATVALWSSRDLIRCDRAPSITNQGRVQIVGESLATSMGLSASPLLGFVGLNLVQRYQCGWQGGSGEDVPWFMSDNVFYTLAGLVLVILFKDVLLSWFPPLKAAIDGIEQLIQLGAAPVALASVATMFTAETGVVFAGGAEQFVQWLGNPQGGQGADVLLASLPLPLSLPGPWLLEESGAVFLGNFLASIVGVIVAFVLFVAGSFVGGLVWLMPIPLVDTALRGARGMAMMGMAGAALVLPLLAWVVALGVFLLALWVFPFALRLLVFGTVNALDLLPFLRGRGMGRAQFVRVFSGKAMPHLPKRTAGRLRRDAATGQLVFSFAPMFILPRRSVAVDEAAPMTVVDGILMPSLRLGFRGTGPAAFLAPARYRKHGERIAERLGLGFAIKGLDGTVREGAAPHQQTTPQPAAVAAQAAATDAALTTATADEAASVMGGEAGTSSPPA
ncbi:MAG: hypothetical protein AAGG79_06255 [Pseudomonadota bacterium]